MSFHDLPLEWQEGDYTVCRNYHWTAPGCHNACGQLVYVKDGRIEKVEGDPEDPYSKGRMCARCLNLPEAYYGEYRIGHPMKRAFEDRGKDAWEQITWDEAYDIIEEKVREIWRDYGAESIVTLQGTGRNIIWQTPFLTFTGFKSPNFGLGFLSGDSCMLPRNVGQAYIQGDSWIVDMGQEHELGMDDPRYVRPEVIMIWGNNPLPSNGDGFLGHWIVEVMKTGTKLVTVDPALTWLAAHSEYWLPIRPGTDPALALGMLNVIINEELYDKEWVEYWTYGFDALKERVQEYPPSKVAEICWIDEDLVYGAARLYANAHPAAIQWGLAVDMQLYGVQCAHALCSMVAICGNLDVPGGNIIARGMFGIDAAYRTGWEFLDPEMQAKCLVPNDEHSGTASGSAQPDTILECIETDDPYPVRMLYLQTTNPIANMGAEAPRVYRAMMKVPFNVVVDYLMTPTAQACCDLFLPCAMGHERNSFRTWWFPLRGIRQLSQFEEAKSDETINVEIGRRLNPELYDELGIYDDKSLLTYVMQHASRPGLDWPAKYEGDFDSLAQQYVAFQDWPYEKYKQGLLRGDHQPGFATGSGRMEIFSLVFQMMGMDPLPYYEEPPESPVSTPELFDEYPCVLTTGQRSWSYFHSENRELPTLRELHPDPMVDINAGYAKSLGIGQGDWVWIENMRGRCRQRANLVETLNEKYVRAEHGWWFPETDSEELFRTFDSNINNLTTMGVVGPSGYGAPYKCTICKVYKCTPENSEVLPTEQVLEKGGFDYVR